MILLEHRKGKVERYMEVINTMVIYQVPNYRTHKTLIATTRKELKKILAEIRKNNYNLIQLLSI